MVLGLAAHEHKHDELESLTHDHRLDDRAQLLFDADEGLQEGFGLSVHVHQIHRPTNGGACARDDSTRAGPGLSQAQLRRHQMWGWCW